MKKVAFARAAENIMLAARAMGYGSVFADIVRKFFKVPKRYSINCLIPIGVPDSRLVKRKRRHLSMFVFHERVPRRSRQE